MARVFVTLIHIELDDEFCDALSPEEVIQARIDQLMELLDVDESTATRLYFRGDDSC